MGGLRHGRRAGAGRFWLACLLAELSACPLGALRLGPLEGPEPPGT